jgi:hypothetical protein
MRSCGCVLGHRDPLATAGMDVDELDADTCRSVIAQNRIGRVVYTYREMPVAAHVDYLDLGDRLLLSLPGDSELIAELSGHVIALLVEEDYERYLRHSVLLTGACLPLGSDDEAGSTAETVYFALHSTLVRGRRSRTQSH